MAAARQIMKISKRGLSIILKPKMGKDCRNKGNKAQCMAQAREALIPKASQLNFIPFMQGKNNECNPVAKHLFN